MCKAIQTHIKCKVF